MSSNTSLPTRSQVRRTLQSQRELWMRHKWRLRCADSKLRVSIMTSLSYTITHHSFSHCRGGRVVLPCGFEARRRWWGGARGCAWMKVIFWSSLDKTLWCPTPPLRIIVSFIPCDVCLAMFGFISPFFFVFTSNAVWLLLETLLSAASFGLLLPTVALRISLLTPLLHLRLNGR